MNSYDDRMITPSLRRRKRRSSRRGCALPYLVLVLIIITAILAWCTRDSHPLRHLLPAGQTYNVVLVDIINSRSDISESRIWEAMPEALATDQAIMAFGQRIQMPDWVLNNIIGPTCFVTGNDLDEFEDVLFVTRMTRVGKVIEAFNRFVPGMERDHAGGLNLRRLPDEGPYYAVRGRLLALSSSRETLIRTLTLTEENRIPQQVFDTALGESGAEQVRGVIALTPDDPMGEVLKSISFALRIEPLAAQLEFRTVFTLEYQATLHPLLAQAQPAPLEMPIDGLIELSANLGMTVNELWTTIEMLLAEEGEPNAWETWKAGLSEEERINLEVFHALLDMVGPGIRLTWRDIDMNEIVPLPTFVATADAPRGTVAAFFESLGPPPEDAFPWEPYPRYDRERQRLSIPMMSGPSLEPTFGLYENGLLASTSAVEAETLLSASIANARPVYREGTLYLRVRPAPSVDAWMKAGRLLAGQQLLRGHTPESFEETAAEWERRAAVLDEITAMLSVGGDGSELRGEFSMTCLPH